MSVYDWKKASAEQMFEHLRNLHEQLGLVTLFLHDRNEMNGGELGTETTRRACLNAEALLTLKPGQTYQWKGPPPVAEVEKPETKEMAA